MKNILAPTDFSLQSLSIVHDIVSREHDKIRIHFFHMVLMPNDISQLLYSRKSHLHAQVPESFIEALQLLKNKYLKKVEKIDFHFYYGSTASVVNSIIENTKADKLYLLANYKYSLPLQSSVNMMPAVNKCKLPAEMVYLKGRIFTQGKMDTLSALLFNPHNNLTLSKQPVDEVYN